MMMNVFGATFYILMAGVCADCGEGFFSNSSGKCIKCSQHCKICVSSECYKCASGFFGKYCENVCNYCQPGTECTGEGFCLVGCKDGLSGNHCNVSCDSRCQSCDRHHPEICDLACPLNCQGHICNGNYCTERCSPGSWGQSCQKYCPEKCSRVGCDRQNGTCHNVSSDTEQPASPTAYKVIVPILSVSLIITFGVVIFTFFIKRKHRHRGTKMAVNQPQHTTNRYSENGLNPNHNALDNDSFENCANAQKTGATNSNNIRTKETVDVVTRKYLIPNETVERKQVTDISEELDEPMYQFPVSLLPARFLLAKYSDKSHPEIKLKLPDSYVFQPDLKEMLRFSDIVIWSESTLRTVKKTFANVSQSVQFAFNLLHVWFAASVVSQPLTVLLYSEQRWWTCCVSEEIKLAATIDVENNYYDTVGLRGQISVQALAEYVNQMSDEDYQEEFERLPSVLIKPCNEALREENVSKNRYRGIYPYDETRVIISSKSSDYINANYIDGYNERRGYIASVDPTVKFMGDMSVIWRVVWQENCRTIVMLTRLVKSEVIKCDEYWPDKNCAKYFGNICLTGVEEEHFNTYITRTLKMERFQSIGGTKGAETRTIRQFHYLAWPNKGLPENVSSLIDLLDAVNATRTKGDGPILVHCSAGVGRTGTFIALDILTKEGKATGHIDIYACVRNLREQRVKMVHTMAQYKFLHHALVYSFGKRGFV